MAPTNQSTVPFGLRVVVNEETSDRDIPDSIDPDLYEAPSGDSAAVFSLDPDDDLADRLREAGFEVPEE